jgi:hypothetical protein
MSHEHIPPSAFFQDPNISSHYLLSDFETLHNLPTFPLNSLQEDLQHEGFKTLNERQKYERVNRSLLKLIQDAPAESFLLTAVLNYIEQVRNAKVLDQSYTLNSFELWLNQFSTLTPQQNREIRAKIVGKNIPRTAYQQLFPIGMNKHYFGPHFITGHLSPDLDTTIASFITWMEAFSARVTEGLHLWNIPTTNPPAQTLKLLDKLFAPGLFTHVARQRESLSITAIDLVSQKDVIKKYPYDRTSQVEHSRGERAIILVDEQGFYLGDWRHVDVESVRMLIFVINNCLRWFETELQFRLISLFTQENLHIKDIPNFVSRLFGTQFLECAPVKELPEERAKFLHSCLMMIFGLEKGNKSSFDEFGQRIASLSIFEFNDFRLVVESLANDELFDSMGYLRENRPKIFFYMEKITKALEAAIESVRNYLDRLDVALKIKHFVLGFQPQYLTPRSDAEEIRTKMGSYHYLTVAYPDLEGRLIPLGVVHAADLRRPYLGTASLRDFCNRTEIQAPPYVEIISVVDHHKCQLTTTTPPTALIADTQSANILLAEQSFALNDRFSTGGMSRNQILQQLQAINVLGAPSPSQLRVQQRLIQRLLAHEEASKGNWYIRPEREFADYLAYLFAIIDDTDLLMKVTDRDVICVAQLINRMVSLMHKTEIEIISYDDIPLNDAFATTLAARILQNEHMFSLYSKTYLIKELEVDEQIVHCAEGRSHTLFADTKEQNGCCRVGQSKLFSNNFPTLQQRKDLVRLAWVQFSKEINLNKPAVDLYLHMVSTIAGANEVRSGHPPVYPHKDEIWIYVPNTPQGRDHLSSYLNAFCSSPEMRNNAESMEVEFLGPNAAELEQLFMLNFRQVPRKLAPKLDDELPMAVLYYKAGSMNSRKAAISPYIPSLEE